jgi:hypothetical protein
VNTKAALHSSYRLAMALRIAEAARAVGDLETCDRAIERARGHLDEVARLWRDEDAERDFQREQPTQPMEEPS